MKFRTFWYAPVLGGLLLAAGCSADNSGGAVRRAGDPHFDPQLSIDSTNVGERPVSKTSQPHSDPQVSIDNFTFTPQTLTVPAGTKVTWTNHDDVPHTATSSTKPRAFDSGTLDSDQQFSYVFALTGTYTYFCAVHPHMTGQIIVK